MKKKITKAILKKREKRLIKRKNKELWNKLKLEVLLRQDFRCYVCFKKASKRKNKIDVHHIIDRRYKPLMYDPANLVGLCSRCHRLAPHAVHQSSIYFSELLRIREIERYNYLLNKFRDNLK